jgi:site-specific recombinase XerD
VLTDELSPEAHQGPAKRGLAPERLTPLLLRFLNRLKVTGRSVHTISAYRNDLNLFCSFLRATQYDLSMGSPRMVDEWLHFLSSHGRHSQASQRRALMSIRTFLHFLIESKVIAASPFLETRSPKQPRSELFCILPTHFRKLCTSLRQAAAAGDEKAIRDLALVTILGRCGLKASEAAGLSWKDVEWNPSGKGNILVRTGKRVRMVPMDAESSSALSALRTLTEHHESSSVFFGFQNITRRPNGKSMQRHGIKFIIYQLCEELLGIPYNSESLRNFAILNWLKKGWDIQKIADLAGYSSLQSLERFAPQDSTLALFRRQRDRRGGPQSDDQRASTQTDRQIRDP